MQPITPFQNKIFFRRLAQLVERHPYKVDVIGSNPVSPTKSKARRTHDIHLV